MQGDWRVVGVAVLLGVVAVSSACSSAKPPDPGPSSSPSPTPSSSPSPSPSSSLVGPSTSVGGTPAVSLSCDAAVATAAEPPEAYRVVDDTVAVPDADVLQPEKNSGGAGPTAMFAKWGLLVRTGASAEVSLPSGWEKRARIGWGRPGDPATRLIVTACPATGAARSWSAFAGGTWVDSPGCVPLQIRTGGRETRVGVAIGVPCPQA